MRSGHPALRARLAIRLLKNLLGVRVSLVRRFEVAEALGAESISTWDGNYYALSIMQRLGLEEHGGGLRIGFLHYTTRAEVDRAIDIVERLARA